MRQKTAVASAGQYANNLHIRQTTTLTLYNSISTGHMLIMMPNQQCKSIKGTATTHTHPFNGPLSRTTQVSRYQKSKTNLDFLKQETVSGSGISWAICKSAHHSRQITTPTTHHSVLYRPDALPAAQPTVSKH